MTLSALKLALRQGVHPTAFGGQHLRPDAPHYPAWRIGAFVVKKPYNIETKDDVKAQLRPSDRVRLAPTVRVGEWAIQVFYPRHQDGAWKYHEWGHLCADIHNNNVGKDRRGRWVAFDW